MKQSRFFLLSFSNHTDSPICIAHRVKSKCPLQFLSSPAEGLRGQSARGLGGGGGSPLSSGSSIVCCNWGIPAGCVSLSGSPNCIHNFFTCRISKHGRCHDLPGLNEFSGVVPSCFTLSSPDQLNGSVTQLNRKTRSDHGSRQLNFQGHGSGRA